MVHLTVCVVISWPASEMVGRACFFIASFIRNTVEWCLSVGWSESLDGDFSGTQIFFYVLFRSFNTPVLFHYIVIINVHLVKCLVFSFRDA